MKSIRWLAFLMVTFARIAELNGAAQDTAFIETRVKTITVDPYTQSPVVILETVADKKLLPIWIDVPEARAIAMELEQIKAPRPLTHDLIRNILQNLGAKVQRAAVTELRNNTYIALLSLSVNGRPLEVDCRPSDAIAIALRMKAPIFASEQVLAKAKPPPAEAGRAGQAQTRLGIQTQDLTAELAKLLDSQQETGVLVAAVESGGISMKAGIAPGDIIVRANGKAIVSEADLESALQAVKSPAQLKLEVIKKGKPTTVMIDLP
jgi:bifunctional DNase/RNase